MNVYRRERGDPEIRQSLQGIRAGISLLWLSDSTNHTTQVVSTTGKATILDLISPKQAKRTAGPSHWSERF